MTHHVILLAHGSRDERWKAPFEQLLNAVRSANSEAQTHLAYMEMTGPTLQETAQQAVQQGATSITVLPLFMASGGHLRHDVPQQIDALQAHHPTLSIYLESPIGEHPAIQQAMQQVISDLL